MEHPCHCWCRRQEAWIIKPPDGSGEPRTPHVPRTEIRQYTQCEEWQQHRGQRCHTGAPPGVVTDCPVPCKPCPTYQPELSWPETYALVHQIGNDGDTVSVGTVLSRSPRWIHGADGNLAHTPAVLAGFDQNLAFKQKAPVPQGQQAQHRGRVETQSGLRIPHRTLPQPVNPKAYDLNSAQAHQGNGLGAVQTTANNDALRITLAGRQQTRNIAWIMLPIAVQCYDTSGPLP